MASHKEDRELVAFYQGEVAHLKSVIEDMGKKLREQRSLRKEWKTLSKQREDIIKERDQLIDDQAAEIRKLQEDYKKEMESVDGLMTEHDQKLKEAYEIIDSMKKQLVKENDAYRELTHKLHVVQNRQKLINHVQF